VTSPHGNDVQTWLIERVRPRWWYVAFVSCSTFPVELHYEGHLENRLQGSRGELSMDEPGVCETSFLVIVFGAVAACQMKSRRRWTEEQGGGPEALGLLSAATVAAGAASACWLQYYWGSSSNGRANVTWLFVGRAGGVFARTLLSMLLLMMAHGESVSSPGLDWLRHKELVSGMSIFGVLSFLLEIYGDTTLQSTTTEYIYDTRLGSALVAFDVFYLWVYCSRSWASFQAETRPKQRIFYKHYAPMFALWFAALPIIAVIARGIAPWYRFYITFLVSGLAQAAALGALVWTFSPDVAPRLYLVEASAASGRHERACNDEELDSMLNNDTDI